MSIWDRSKKVADQQDDTKQDDDKPAKKGPPFRVTHKKCGTISIHDSVDGHDIYCAHCQTRRPNAEFKI